MAWHSLCRKSYNLKLNDLRLPVYLAQFFVILENIGVCQPALLRGPPMLPALSPDRAGLAQLRVAVARWRTTCLHSNLVWAVHLASDFYVCL